jgi:tetratricopeptide (TPR) repeat protein
VVQAGSVTGGVHFHQPPAAAGGRTTPKQLPADCHAFVNRNAELRALDAVLPVDGDGPPAVPLLIVAGTAGAGKTSLVLRWVYRVRDRFPDGQLFVNLRGYDPGEPVAAHQALRGFLSALGVPAAEVPQDLDSAAALYRTLLADRRVLVLLDNAATVGQVRPLLPGSGGSLTVVTSRNRMAGLAIHDGARRLTLGTLPEPEAVALLREVTGDHRRADEEEKLAELARLCAFLPLALRIAAERAASHPHMGLDELVADLRDQSALWDALSTGSDAEADAVRTVFTWSYRALPPEAARLFRLLGLHPAPEFGLHAASALGGLPPRKTRRVLDDLVGAHLVEQTAPDRYQFHDLLRAYATDQAVAAETAEQRQAALHRVVDWYLHSADAAQSWLRPDEDHVGLAESTATAVPAPAFGDYDAAADWSEREHTSFPHVMAAAVSAGLHQKAWQLAVVLFNALSESVSYVDWVPLGLAGLGSAEECGDQAALVALHSRLGMAYRSLSRLGEAAEHLERALSAARACGDRREEAHALNLIGLIHLRAWRLDAAAEHFERAAAAFRGMGEEGWEAVALSNTAATLLRAGRLSEAAPAVDGALAAHRARNNRQSVGNALNLAAALHRERGELVEARRAIDEALDIALARRDHATEGYWLLTLGDIQRDSAQYGDALASYRRSAALHRRLADRSREALAWRGTGQTYTAMERRAEAAAFHRRAVAVHRDLDDTWQLAVELDRLAAAVHPEDPDTARAHWTEALACLTSYPDPRSAALRARITESLADRG